MTGPLSRALPFTGPLFQGSTIYPTETQEQRMLFLEFGAPTMAAFDLPQKGPTVFLVFVVFWLDGVKHRSTKCCWKCGRGALVIFLVG